MTRVSAIYAGGRAVGLTVDGHAGYAQSGRDIVCAAVSCLATTCVNALEAVAGVPPLVQMNENDGRMDIRLPDALTPQAAHDADIILRTAVQGYRDLAQAYPKQVMLFDGGI